MASSLVEVCYERIRDNFWNADYGTLKVIIDINTGYFNATKLCALGGKQFCHWLENKASQSYMQYLNEHSNIWGSGHQKIKYEIKGGHSNQYGISGTYVCKELICDIACWVSPDFKFKVSQIVENFFTHKYVEVSHHNLVKADLKKSIDEMQLKNENLRLENTKYARVEEDIAPKTVDRSKFHTFTLIKKNIPICSYPYHVMRTQRVNFGQSIKNLKKKFPDMEIKYKMEYNPNAINLFNRMKEQIQGISFRYNGLKLLNNFTEEQLIRDIKELAKINI